MRARYSGYKNPLMAGKLNVTSQFLVQTSFDYPPNNAEYGNWTPVSDIGFVAFPFVYQNSSTITKFKWNVVPFEHYVRNIVNSARNPCTCLIVRKTMPSTPGNVSIAIVLIDFSIVSSAIENGVKF